MRFGDAGLMALAWSAMKMVLAMPIGFQAGMLSPPSTPRVPLAAPTRPGWSATRAAALVLAILGRRE